MERIGCENTEDLNVAVGLARILPGTVEKRLRFDCSSLGSRRSRWKDGRRLHNKAVIRIISASFVTREVFSVNATTRPRLRGIPY